MISNDPYNPCPICKSHKNVRCRAIKVRVGSRWANAYRYECGCGLAHSGNPDPDQALIAWNWMVAQIEML